MKRNKELNESYHSFIDDLMFFVKETKEFNNDNS